MKNGANKTTQILVVVIVLFVILALTSVIYFNSKVKALGTEKAALLANVTELSIEKNNLLSEKANLEKESRSTKDQFENFKSVLKQYTSTLKVLGSDVKAVVATAVEYQNFDGTDYAENKIIANKYESQLGILKNHLNKYQEFLKNNSAIFDEIGIDIKKEVDGIEKALPLYDDSLYRIKFEVEALRFKGTITDVLGTISSRTYMITNLDYEVEVTSINVSKQTASFNINGMVIEDLKVGSSHKLVDGAELGIFVITEESGVSKVRFYLGK